MIYGALMGIAIVFAMSRFGVRMAFWREGLFGVLCAIAFWFVLRLAGLDMFWSTTIGVLLGSSVLGLWRRFVRRSVDAPNPAQRI